MIQLFKGPIVDVKISSKVDTFGNISDYSVSLTMNEGDYYEFLERVNSENYGSLQEYIFRNINDESLFTYKIDIADTTTIELISKDEFDPNDVFPFISISKTNTTWHYEDNSLIQEYYIPDIYFDEMTYELTLPSKVIAHNSDIQPKEKRGDYILSWSRNRDRDDALTIDNKMKMPQINADFQAPVPTTSGFGILILISGLVIVLLIDRIKS